MLFPHSTLESRGCLPFVATWRYRTQGLGASGSSTQRAHEEPKSEASRLLALAKLGPSWLRRRELKTKPLPSRWACQLQKIQVGAGPCLTPLGPPTPRPMARVPLSWDRCEPGGWGACAGRGTGPARRSQPQYGEHRSHCLPPRWVRDASAWPLSHPEGQAQGGCTSHAGGHSVCG